MLSSSALPVVGHSQRLSVAANVYATNLQAVVGWSWRRGVTARTRVFAWAVLALYTFSTYSEVRLHSNFDSSWDFVFPWLSTCSFACRRS